MQRRQRRKAEYAQGQSQESAQDMIASLYGRYRRYALPNDETRRLLDHELGDKALTEVLYEMREGR